MEVLKSNILLFFHAYFIRSHKRKYERWIKYALLTKSIKLLYSPKLMLLSILNYREKAKRKRSNMKQAKIIQRSEERE